MKITSLFLVVLVGLLFFSCNKKKTLETAALEVPVTSVLIKDVPLTQEYVGQTLGGTDIQIRARVQGFLTGMYFREGSAVKKGQLLYSIDPLPYQAKLDQAKGQLAEAEALLAKAKSDLDRIKPLAAINAVSQRDLVAAQAQFDASIGRLEAAQGMVNNAQIELSYATITSPIDGIIGISNFEVGDLVGTIQSFNLNTVSSTKTIRVRFSVTEAEYLEFRKRVPDKNKMDWTIEMILSDGSIHPHKGQINLANREIDPSTGTLTMEATVPNPEENVRPGQFAKVRFITEVRKGAMLIPLRAVTELQGTYQVYVVSAENKVEIKTVQAGQKYGEYWIIDSGLEATDKVALVGNIAIRVNSAVKPVPVKADSTKI
ncbi:MAG: efflux RND transporter periplasmic adaptor subunit [Bacteroidales bacterium]|nr:efflux RND transporter periplasmic adaptor subunit [Bacteroidales bacterium]